MIAPTPTRFSNCEVNHLTANSLRNFPNSPQLLALDTTHYSQVEDTIVASLNLLASMEPLDSISNYPTTTTATNQSENNLPLPQFESPEETLRAQDESSNYINTMTSSISNLPLSHSTTQHSNSSLLSSQSLHSTPYSHSSSFIKILHCSPLQGSTGTSIIITIATQVPFTSTFNSQSNSLEPFYGSSSANTSLSSTSTSNSLGTRNFKIVFNSLQLPTNLSKSSHVEALGTKGEDSIVVLSALVPERERLASDDEVSIVSIIIEDEVGRIVEKVRVGEWSNTVLHQRKSFHFPIFNLNSGYNLFDFPYLSNWIFCFPLIQLYLLLEINDLEMNFIVIELQQQLQVVSYLWALFFFGFFVGTFTLLEVIFFCFFHRCLLALIFNPFETNRYCKHSVSTNSQSFMDSTFTSCST